MSSKARHSLDPLNLDRFNHEALIPLVSPLTGKNYIGWCNHIELLLTATVKLDFITGKCERPTERAKAEQWDLVDSMVRSLILGSVSKEIAQHFIHAKTAKSLWEEIKGRYGSHGPLLYRIHRKLRSIRQGNADLFEYYSKLCNLWSELHYLKPIPVCKCKCNVGKEISVGECNGCILAKQIADDKSETELFQFLMGLNDCYDNVRDLILLMEPLPTPSKAYSMLLGVETMRELSKGEKGCEKTHDLVCSYCKKIGHTHEGCFKLHPKTKRSM
ncbi:uncharacterized protein LOC124910669 [Impatiens glandulifera]|uniref:uncharacterized protein LOC124910669 n=1 Tax=Impatiens glandulifera TaxID=253017 RepID=UPI001FB07C5B|nr:uncharacterized protein LOC124910669 [Impatiens glandulifera]XP_047307301.1 uncharacterized protein LOC124910669 [Impatiens glandulifera]